MKDGRMKQCILFVWWLGFVVQLLVLAKSSLRTRWITRNNSQSLLVSHPVRLHVLDHHHVMVENGIIKATFSTPGGMMTRIQFNGIDNILDDKNNRESNRGYWDVAWSEPENTNVNFDRLKGTKFRVVMEEEDQIELSFMKTWSSLNNSLSLNIDKRYIVLRGISGFYTYGIFERLDGWPDIDIHQGRIVFKLQKSLFQYMAVSDDRIRMMPTDQDRLSAKPLDYPEAVLLTNTSNSFFDGEVDDKYQYSSESKDNRVHGWICLNPTVGFWVITPSIEFRTGGPVKQELTSHVGPISLSMLFSTHYAGKSLVINFRGGEAWKKVFGPVFIYLNSGPSKDPLSLWLDAKTQMTKEIEMWPYNFPLSKDSPPAHLRGAVSGRLLIRDRYINATLIKAKYAYVGLAQPGKTGSWQFENKGYQFWTQTDAEGHFLISGVRAGNYSLYASVPGFIGDYKYDGHLNITSGNEIEVGDVVYVPPRNGPTLWEIGVPDRTAAEFYVPNPKPTLVNKIYLNHKDKFRQYGLWDQYTNLYPDEDLAYVVGISNYRKDWFFAHVNRNIGNRIYKPTTWKIIFSLIDVNTNGNYTLQLALASATYAELQVRINDEHVKKPHFTTGLIGWDNAIGRHGIHGLYWLYSINVAGSQFVIGNNTIFLTQARGSSPFAGVMYDYLRLEQPPDTSYISKTICTH